MLCTRHPFLFRPQSLHPSNRRYVKGSEIFLLGLVDQRAINAGRHVVRRAVDVILDNVDFQARQPINAFPSFVRRLAD